MRILLSADPFIPVPPKLYGGIERIVDALARYYTKSGHTVGLIAHPESTCAVDTLFRWPGSQGAFGEVRNTVALATAAGSFRPDLLHSFSRLSYLLPILNNSLPKVMSYQRHTGGRQIKWASLFAGPSLKFTGCSEFICKMGRPWGGEWHTIHNFIELEKLTFVPLVADDAPLLFLSRIESIKGPDIAIEIARKSGRRLILAGNRPESGPELAFWDQKIAKELGHGGVEWVGPVDDEQKNRLLGGASALLVPIQWDEPFGIVFAEALATGTPVITCSRGATPEIIDEGKTGFFIHNTIDGAAAVDCIHTLDRSACRSAAEGRFSLESCAQKYLALYQEIMRETRESSASR